MKRLGEPKAFLVMMLAGVLAFPWQGSAQAMLQPPADVLPVGGWTLEQEWNAAHVLPSARQVAWQWQEKPDFPTLVVDMEKFYPVRGFTYLPTSTEPWVRDYVFMTSEDGQVWSPAAEGAFGNIENSPVLQTVPFAPRQARYFKFTSKADTKDRPRARTAEIGVLVEKR